MSVQPRVIFVFGSNVAGRHLGGAARDAARFWGAESGVGIGPTGEAYALPTMDENLEPLTLAEIGHHAREFLAYAATHTDQTFYVTPVGCGIAGFTETEIAPLFVDAPSNVQLPKGWRS